MSSLVRDAVLLAFEGPDPYSMVGGLGTRVTELSAALATAGIRTTLVFVGDPARPAVERAATNLQYRRWCRSLSARYPGGVYDGEIAKSIEYAASVPAFVAETIVEPAAKRGESVLVLAEDWQMAPCAILLDQILRDRSLREGVILAWNANNTYGFDRIGWPALVRATQITTVSRYMQFELRVREVESLVIPNGVPERLLDGVPEALVRSAAGCLRDGHPLFVKVGRFDEDKGWMQAIDAFAEVRVSHPGARLAVRGGREAYGDAVFGRACERGLSVDHLTLESLDARAVLAGVAGSAAAIVNIRSYVPEEALLTLYRVADAVLANSNREPFGLVGLEAMSAGGLVVTGATGEDYAVPFENALVCETAAPSELAELLESALADRALAQALRAAGLATAKGYVWARVLQTLARKLRLAFPDTL